LRDGYPSLFEWSVSVLKYSAGEANRRIQAMRLLKTLPEIEEKLASGRLSLTSAAHAQSAFRREDQRRKENGEASLTREEKRQITLSLLDTSTREAEAKLHEFFPDQKKDRKLEIPLSPELEEKIEELKGLLSEVRLEVLIEKAIDLALGQLRPKATRATPAPERGVPTSRYIPQAIQNAVRIRDQNRCTFTSRDGRICGTRFHLEFDHLLPYAYGGQHSLENLTLRCRAHNQYAAQKMGFKRPMNVRTV
jgi:hypothetical protein